MDKLDNDIEKALQSIPKTLCVKVTWEHIAKARRIIDQQGQECSISRSTICPVAQALMEMGYTVRVGHVSVTFFHYRPWSWQRQHLMLPHLAQNFIQHFDRNNEVEPIEFEIGEDRG